MRQISVLTAASILAIWAAAPALSADYPVLRGSQIDTAPPSPVSGSGGGIDWSGFYIGGHGSMTASKFNKDTAIQTLTTAVTTGLPIFNTTSLAQPVPTPRNTDSGIGFGVLAGYNVMIGDVVVGGEVDYSVHNQSIASQTFDQRFNGTDRLTLTSNQAAKLQDHASIRLRAGWVTGIFMPFMTAGLAVGRFDTSFLATGNREALTAPGVYTSYAGYPANVGRAEKDAWGIGATVGAGVDIALSETFFVRGEYLYTTFNKVNGVGVNLHTARVAGAVKF